MPATDLILVTEDRYEHPSNPAPYVQNILKEDELLIKELASKGITARRVSWSSTEVNWEEIPALVIRTTWDYFDRFEEFCQWLESIPESTICLNSKKIIRQNWDKFYLKILARQSVPVPPTLFIEKGSDVDVESYFDQLKTNDIVAKPAVGGGGRLTFRINKADALQFSSDFERYVRKERFLVQKFMPSIIAEGEVSLMFFEGKFSHSVKKRAKQGDFRVQDDFGGTVEHYIATEEEIEVARMALNCLPEDPVYARADLVYSDFGSPLLSELELIEPELWMRFHPESAGVFASAIARNIRLIPA